jgi:uroporphyrinogen decarboxylase
MKGVDESGSGDRCPPKRIARGSYRLLPESSLTGKGQTVTNRKRFLTALFGGVPDRVPIFDFAFNEASIINVGRYFTTDLPALKPFIDCTPAETRHYFDVYLRIVEALDLDAMVLIFAAGGQRQASTEDRFTDDLGTTYVLSEHGDPFPVAGPVQDPSDLKRLMFPDPTRYFETFDYVRARLPDRALVFCVPGTFKFSWNLMGGMEKLLLAYGLQPEFSLELARRSTDYIKILIDMAIDRGADAILLDGDLASQNNVLMSPAHYRKYLKPYHRECVDGSHARDIPIFKHTDGNFWKILDDLLELGFDGLHPIQPQCMDINEVRAHVNGRACLLGNIDCAHLLPSGSETEVVASVKERISTLAPGGGYILSSSNTIHPGCDPANVIAMFRAAREFGAYPICSDENGCR